jgi:hypothetical protein
MATMIFARVPRSHRPANLGAVAWQTLVGLLIAAVTGLLILYVVPVATLKGVAVGVVVVGSIWFLTTRNSQLALAMILLYIGLLDGYLKLASGSSVVTFVRDAFIFSLTIGLLARAVATQQRLRMPPLSLWLVAWTVIVLVEFANPRSGTLLHSIAGARQHLEFVPLFFLTYLFLRTTRALRMFCILLGVVAAANGIAGFVQLKETPQQFAAWGPGYSERVLGTGAFAGGGRTGDTGVTGSSTRPFGLGSDAGDGGLVGMIAICGILVLAAFSRRRHYQLLAMALALLAIVAIVTSQGRTVVLGSGITVIVFCMLTLTAGSRLKSLSGLVIVLTVSALVVVALVGVAGAGGFRYGGLAPSGIISTTSSARGVSIDAIPDNVAAYPFGAGVGTAGPASGSPGGSSLTQSATFNVETEFSFLLVETGIPGLFVMTGFVLTLLYVGLSRLRREPDPEAKVFLAALMAPLPAIFIQFFISTPTPSTPIGPYLFALGGIISYWLVERPAARRLAAGVYAGSNAAVLGQGAAAAAIAAPNSLA